MGKYNKLSDFQIQSGIEEGKFREEGVLIRNVSNGETVKIRSTHLPETVLLPPTFVQVNNTTIYQADLAPVFKAIIENRNLVSFSELEENYNVLINYLNSYVTYKHHLPELLNCSLSTSTIFENRLRRYSEELDLKNLDTICLESYFGALKGYVHVMFVHIVSSFLTHREMFKNDSIIISQILNIEMILKRIYEQLLVSSKYDEKDKCHRMNMDNSIYALYMFDDDYSLKELEGVVEHDSRFDSSLDVVDFFKRFNKEDRYESNDSGHKLRAKLPLLSSNSNQIKLLDGLKSTFNELNRLKIFREEILTINEKEVLDMVMSDI